MPLRKLVLPSDIAHTELGNLGGHTMHSMAARDSESVVGRPLIDDVVSTFVLIGLQP